MAVGARLAVLERDPNMLVDQPVQVGRHALRLLHPAEVHDVNGFRLEREHPVDRAVQRGRIEMDGRGGRERELPAVPVELAIRQPERVPGEDVAARRVAHHDVVARMAGGVIERKLAPRQQYRATLHRLDDSRLGDREDFAIHAVSLVFSVYAYRSLDQLRRVHHVARTQRVHREACIGAAAHELTRTGGMVEMNMGQHDPVDPLGRHAFCRQSIQHARRAAARGRVDDRRTPFLDDDMDRALKRPHEVRIDCADAVQVIKNTLHIRADSSGRVRIAPVMLAADLRREYMLAGLAESDADADPLKQFERWFQDALAADLPLPNAMTLATAGEDGRADARIVLLKGIERDGFVFFTNYESRKGRELARDARACLVFFWSQLERQVRVEGRVGKVDPGESDAYFATRPLGARLSAWASAQSAQVESRAALEKSLEQMHARHGSQPPRPPHWGGYRVLPEAIEFWQGRENRLHDRLLYRRSGEGWTRSRLAP